MSPPPGKVSPERYEAWQRLRHLRHATDARRLDPAAPAGDPARRRRAQSDRLVRGVLRHLSLLDALMAQTGLFSAGQTPQAVRWVLRMAAYERIFQSAAPDYAIGEQAVELARSVGGARMAGFMNAVVRRLLPLLPDSAEALEASPAYRALDPATRWSIPTPILDELTAGYGGPAEAAPVLAALATRESPTWLRVNTLRTTPEAALAALTAEGVEVETGPVPWALRWRGGECLPWQTEPWSRGELTVQDLGAMTAGRLLDVQPGQRVLDACAAPGGKTGQLWERMGGQGRLVAVEVDGARRDDLCRTLKRLYGGDHGIETPGVPALDALPAQALFDRVLLDVPCLALGLIGRHPEIRWDRRLKLREAMTATQHRLLEGTAPHVAPGGRLLWVTCSPGRTENEALIGPWLAARPDWSVVDPRSVLEPAWSAGVEVRDGFVRTRPDRVPCDGFAMILLERHGASAI